jgi:hypothetical protein
MKRFSLFLCFVFGNVFCFAQGPGFEWVRSMVTPQGQGFSVGNSTVFDASGNVYTCGYFAGTTDFDPGQGVYTLTSVPSNSLGTNDVFVSKLDASGNFIWAKSFGGTGQDNCQKVTLDASGNVYIIGMYYQTADFDPGPGTFTLTAVGSSDSYIVKLDASGNFVWAKSFSGATTENVFDIATDPQGNIYTTGGFTGSTDFDPGPATFSLASSGLYDYDVFISKLDNAGNFVWVKQIGGSSFEGASAIALDGLGNIYTAGNFRDTTDFDPGPGSYTLASAYGTGTLYAGTGDIFISKLDASGNFVWAKKMGGISDDYPRDMVLDGSGNIYIAGSFKGTADFDPGPGTSTLTTSIYEYNMFISKLDASGNFVWANNFGGNSYYEGAVGMAIDGSDNIYTIGHFFGTVDFDPGAGVANLIGTTGPSAKNIFISKLNSSGGFMWAGAIVNQGDLYASSIAVDPTGVVFATGAFAGVVDFDPDGGITNLTAASGDAFTLKMAACCAGVHELNKNNSGVLIYPNPNNGSFNLNVDTEMEAGKLVLFNLLGQKVHEQKVIRGLNQIRNNNLKPGLYNCRLITEQHTIEIGKLTIE